MNDTIPTPTRYCGQAWHDEHDWTTPAGLDPSGAMIIVEPTTYHCPGKPLDSTTLLIDSPRTVNVGDRVDFPRVEIPHGPPEPEPPTPAQQIREQLNRAVFEVYPSGDLWRFRLRIGDDVVMAGEAYTTQKQARDVCSAIRQAVRHSAEIVVQL